MKKIITIALALLMVISLVACGTADNNQGGTNTPSNQQGNNTPDSQGSNNGNNQGNNTAEGAKLNEKLNLINLDDRDPSVLRGVTIEGNCAGTAEGFNNKECAFSRSGRTENDAYLPFFKRKIHAVKRIYRRLTRPRTGALRRRPAQTKRFLRRAPPFCFRRSSSCRLNSQGR